MKLYVSLVLAGIVLIVTQRALLAQDGQTEKERAIAAIKAMGGKVVVDSKRPGSPIVGVDLSHTKITDASLEHLKALPTLEMLVLKNTPVTDDGIVYVKGLTNLEVLELGRTKVTDKGLVNLQNFTKILRLDLGARKSPTRAWNT